MAVSFIKAPSCVECANRKSWSNLIKYKEEVTEFDRCAVAKSQGERNGGYIESVIKHPDWYEEDNVNPRGDCSRKLVKETIKNSRLWVSLYFKGRERDWIIVEPDRHEIFIEANWFVKKVFGIADRFHKWQDARAVKRFERTEAKRRAKVLTHIVKELPRL